MEKCMESDGVEDLYWCEVPQVEGEKERRSRRTTTTSKQQQLYATTTLTAKTITEQ